MVCPHGISTYNFCKLCQLSLSKYSRWQLLTVQRMNTVGIGYQGVVPMITLPVSLIGKVVKVTIEEQ